MAVPSGWSWASRSEAVGLLRPACFWEAWQQLKHEERLHNLGGRCVPLRSAGGKGWLPGCPVFRPLLDGPVASSRMNTILSDARNERFCSRLCDDARISVSHAKRKEQFWTIRLGPVGRSRNWSKFGRSRTSSFRQTPSAGPRFSFTVSLHNFIPFGAGLHTTRVLQTCTFQGPAAWNTTKIPREDPQDWSNQYGQTGKSPFQQLFFDFGQFRLRSIFGC